MRSLSPRLRRGITSQAAPACWPIPRWSRWLRATVVALVFASTNCMFALTIDFEQPVLVDEFENGADWDGGVDLGGVEFNNEYLTAFDAWSGWSLSRATDTTTPGFLNQYSAWPGSGAGDSSQYAVAYSGLDVGAGVAPIITLPDGALPRSAQIANTTYAAVSIQTGDSFARAFDDGDWFRLTIHARDAQAVGLASIEVMLADFRNGQESLLEGWTELDLTPLAVPGVASLEFRLTSSDVGQFGMNTPAYFALDDLVLEEATLAGDFNADGRVDAVDYAVWREGGGDAAGLQDWRESYGMELPSAAVTTPEPASFGLLLALLFVQFLFCDLLDETTRD